MVRSRKSNQRTVLRNEIAPATKNPKMYKVKLLQWIANHGLARASRPSGELSLEIMQWLNILGFVSLYCSTIIASMKYKSSGYQARYTAGESGFRGPSKLAHKVGVCAHILPILKNSTRTTTCWQNKRVRTHFALELVGSQILTRRIHIEPVGSDDVLQKIESENPQDLHCALCDTVVVLRYEAIKPWHASRRVGMIASECSLKYIYSTWRPQPLTSLWSSIHSNSSTLYIFGFFVARFLSKLLFGMIFS